MSTKNGHLIEKKYPHRKFRNKVAEVNLHEFKSFIISIIRFNISF